MTSVRPALPRGFRALLACQLTAALNDQLFKSALMTYVTARQARLAGVGPASMLGLISATFIAPFFLCSASAGQLADRLDKARIVRWAKRAELLIMAVAAVGFARESLLTMLLALFLLGVHSAVLGPVKYGIVPELVQAHELVSANALLETTTFVAILLGTVLGATLVLLPHGASYLALTGLSLAAVGVYASSRLPSLVPQHPTLRVHRSPLAPMREILSICTRSRSVLLAILGISFFWLVGVTLLSFLPTYVHDTLRVSPHLVTLLLALFCVGIALGSLASERISGRAPELALVQVGALGMTVCLLDLCFARVPSGASGELASLSSFFARDNALRLCVDLLLLSMFGGLYTVPLYTLLQQRAAEKERARVIAGNNIFNALFMVLGSLALSLVTARGLSGQWVFLGLGACSLLLSVWLLVRMPEYLMRFVASVLGRVMYRLEVRGSEHIPAAGPLLLVCNHVSFNDWLVLAGSVKRPIRFVMDHRMAALPGLATLLRSGKVIPIAPEHEDKALMERAFARIGEELRAGEIVCIYPEGKITRNGALNPFKAGVERIVRETEVQVVPMAIHGLWGSFFSRAGGPAMKKLPRRFRARLRLQIGTPIAGREASALRLEGEVKHLLEAAESH